jgi:hypothetical protein
MHESTTYQAIVEEGQVEGVKRFLLLAGPKRFGPPEATVRAALERVTRWEELAELQERLFEASSWEELLGLPHGPQELP